MKINQITVACTYYWTEMIDNMGSRLCELALAISNSYDAESCNLSASLLVRLYQLPALG